MITLILIKKIIYTINILFKEKSVKVVNTKKRIYQ